MFPTITKVMAFCAAALIMVIAQAAAKPHGGAASKHAVTTKKKSSDAAPVDMVLLQLDTNALVPSKPIRPLQNDSISPWTYSFSHDESLYPPTLAEARCLLQGCLDSEGLEDLNLESRPIMHQVLLLRRVPSSEEVHGYHYRLEYRFIAVGCTCVRPIVRHQQ